MRRPSSRALITLLAIALFARFIFATILVTGPQSGKAGATHSGQNQTTWSLIHTPKSASKLRKEHDVRIANKTVQAPVEIPLHFKGMDFNSNEASELTVYNPAGWFDSSVGGKAIRVYAGRRETNHSETDSRVGFYFLDAHDVMTPFATPDIPKLDLQDPFVVKIGIETILGGVKVDVDDHGNPVGYSTVLYRDHGMGLSGFLEPFYQGPPKMKDIRLVELSDGRILVFTRPQGPIKGGLGKVGTTIISKLGDLGMANLEAAALVEGQFLDEEWGGANAAYVLNNGVIGVLGHIARFEKGVRQYYAVAWAFNPLTSESTPMEVILCREDLPGGLERGHKFGRADLSNVIFPGQLQRMADGTAILSGGEGDRRPFSVRITDPFTKFEKLVL